MEDDFNFRKAYLQDMLDHINDGLNHFVNYEDDDIEITEVIFKLQDAKDAIERALENINE